MASPSDAPLIATLLPVIVGGLIGVSGGLLGPLVLERFRDASHKTQTRAQKLEELVVTIYEHDYWLEQERAKWANGAKVEPGLSPFAKLHAIATLHFPEFENRIKKLEKVARAYRQWMYSAGQMRLTGKLEHDTVGFEKVYAPYWDEVSELLKEVTQYARSKLAKGT